MLADVLEYPLTPVDVSAASGRGAAMLARRVSGAAEGEDDGQPARSLITAQPDPARSRCYRDRYAAYRSTVEALVPR
jgi:sugar (pentulose or hexulose) kinase